jgi:arylformamidase
MILKRRMAIFGCVASLFGIAIFFGQIAAQESDPESDSDGSIESPTAISPGTRPSPPEEFHNVPFWPEGPGDAEYHYLDVYPAKAVENAPILVFVHGGAWQIGSKEFVQEKPVALNQRGIHFVSTNYRLHPHGNYQDQAADVAHAVAWVHQNAQRFGGDPHKIVLMGHSAGAHLAALVAINDRYLKPAGVSPSVLRGVILLDGAGYDIPLQIKGTTLRRSRTMYETVFTTDRETQLDASPITHVRADRGTPPFLMFYVQHRWDSKSQAENLAEKLQQADVSAKVMAADHKTHVTINREFGDPDDKVTEESLAFLREVTETR